MANNLWIPAAFALEQRRRDPTRRLLTNHHKLTNDFLTGIEILNHRQVDSADKQLTRLGRQVPGLVATAIGMFDFVDEFADLREDLDAAIARDVEEGHLVF